MTNPPELLTEADREALDEVPRVVLSRGELHAVVERIVRARMAAAWDEGAWANWNLQGATNPHRAAVAEGKEAGRG